MKQVYFDNAATTAIRPEVIDRMIEVMRDMYIDEVTGEKSERFDSLKSNLQKAILTMLQ